MPWPGGSSRPQPIASAAFSQHSATPQLVSVGPEIATSPGRDRFFIRNSTASMPSRSAIMSVWHSAANVNCGLPNPRNAPPIGLLRVDGVAVVAVGGDAVDGAAEHRLRQRHAGPV